MDNNLIVFQEAAHYFGIFPKEFDSHLSLGKVDIFPSVQEEEDFIWRFKDKGEQARGVFAHLGSLFDSSRINFSQSGHIFLQKISDQVFLGVLADNFCMEISKKKIMRKNIVLSRFKPGVPDIAHDCFRIMLRYKKRNIFIIEPRILFDALELNKKIDEPPQKEGESPESGVERAESDG